MKILSATFALLFLASASFAQTVLPQSHIYSLACIENMGQTTTWGQCLDIIFEPCAAHEVGSEDHVACLSEEKTGWTKSMDALQADVTGAVTSQAALDLVEILGGWYDYVSQKCEAVSVQNASSGGDSAKLGCEITEIVGVTGEYAACLEGRLTAEFCELK